MASGNANVGVLGVLLFICCLSFARAHSGQVLTSILTQAFKPQKGWRYARWPWMPLDESGQNHLICVHKLTLKFLFQLCTNHTRFFSKIKRPAATLSVQGPMTYEVTWLSNFKSSMLFWCIVSKGEFLKQPQPAVKRSTDRIKVVGIPASRTLSHSSFTVWVQKNKT